MNLAAHSPVLTPPAKWRLQIVNDSGEPLVTVERDGTVTIHKHGAEQEAAERFWRAVEAVGRRPLA